MRNRLSRRHGQNVFTDFAPEYGWEDIDHPPWLLAQPLMQAFQRNPMPFDQMIEPGMGPSERLIVRWKHQDIFWQQRFQFLAAFQPIIQGIGVRLSWKHRNI